jgi:hypothetical protein
MSRVTVTTDLAVRPIATGYGVVIPSRIRDLAVPNGISSISAISRAVMPCTTAITTARACSAGIWASERRSWADPSPA